MRTVLFVFLASIAIDGLAADFRSADFGMTREQVKATEPDARWLETEKQMGFHTEVAGLDVQATYVFHEGVLAQTGYSVIEAHADDNGYISDYKKLKDLLTEKYGKPTLDDTLWRSDLYKNDPSRHGFAVSIGHMVSGAQWETEKMDVSLHLSGDNYDVSLWIIYTSKAHKNAAQEARKQDDMKDL